MTKKDFIALADIMRQRIADVNSIYVRSPLCHTVALRKVEGDIKALADFCQSQNPEFGREEWLERVSTGKERGK